MMELPQVQTRGEPLFLINYINIFNSKGQFPSYLIISIGAKIKAIYYLKFSTNFNEIFSEYKFFIVYVVNFLF